MKERKSDWARKVSLNQPDFFFLVKGEEEEEGDAMKIKMNEEFASTTQARRESEGGKSVI